MSTTGLTYAFGAGTVTLTAAGLIDAVATERPYLTGGGEVRTRQQGAAVAWRPGEASVDADEVEVSWSATPGLRAAVRHSFGSAWRVRLAVTNAGPGPVAFDDLELGWRPAGERPAWGLAAGAVGAAVVLPGSAGGPVLAGTLEYGSCTAVTVTGLSTGPVTLAPGSRYVLQWHWDWYDHPRDVVRRRPGQPGFRQVPRRLVWPAGSAASITTGPDEALLVTPGVTVDPVEDQQELTGSPGEHRIEVRSHRGVTAYALTWVEPAADLLVDRAEALLRGPTTSAGVVRLDSPSAALAVQLALTLGRAPDATAADEALERYVSLLEPVEGDPQLHPLDLLLLCAEVDRTGQTDLLELAVRSTVGPAPGADLGRRQRLITDLVAGRRHPELTGPAPVQLSELVALTDGLGGGLAGQPVRALPAEEEAYRLAVLCTTDEHVTRALNQRLADSLPGLLAAREAALVARLTNEPLGPAHGWLAIVARSR